MSGTKISRKQLAKNQPTGEMLRRTNSTYKAAIAKLLGECKFCIIDSL